MYSLSLPLCGHTIEFHLITILTRSVILLFLERYLFVVCGGLFFLISCLHPSLSLTVFAQASVFNRDVSKWNTGAVATMQSSKCTLSLPLCGHAFCCCVFEYDNSSFIGSQFSHVLLFCSVFLKRCLFCCLCGGFGLSFLCCTLLSSCSVL